MDFLLEICHHIDFKVLEQSLLPWLEPGVPLVVPPPTKIWFDSIAQNYKGFEGSMKRTNLIRRKNWIWFEIHPFVPKGAGLALLD